MNVAKRFRFEAAHRLPWHEAECKHLHGHSYRMTVEVEGEPDDQGMLIDFKYIKEVLSPLIERWDHATLVAESDTDLLQVLGHLDTKHVVLPYDTTAENLCHYVADFLGTDGYEVLSSHDVTALRVRISETETCYAEVERSLSAYESGGTERMKPVTERAMQETG